MNRDNAELVRLLRTVRRYPENEALGALLGLSRDSQTALLDALRLEQRGQQLLPLPHPEPLPRPKKVSYSLLLPPDLLEAVRIAACRDGSSASQFIRTAIAKQLGRVK